MLNCLQHLVDIFLDPDNKDLFFFYFNFKIIISWPGQGFERKTTQSVTYHSVAHCNSSPLENIYKKMK